jgi:ABC-2 type transport system ATP-binding protein
MSDYNFNGGKQMGPILEVQGVTNLYKNGRGIRDVSFNIDQGNIFGFFGPNGAGKTTLLKIITGLIRPRAGTIRINGYSVADELEQALAHVGCVIESADAYEYMSAYENLRLASRFYSDLPKTRIDQTLEQVGLLPYKKERVGGYSLGMKQRLALASALLSNPRLVILDEPTNGLDIEGMIDIRNTINQLAREHEITFLISSHMINDMEQYVNHIGLLHQGVLIRQGDIHELLSQGMSLEQFYMSEILSAKDAEIYA